MEKDKVMSNLSKFLRKLRIDNDEFLVDMAKTLEISSAHLSSIENGRKTVPADFSEKLKSNYNLTDEQTEELETYIAEANRQVLIDLESIQEKKNFPVYAKTAVKFAKELSKLDTSHLDQIQQILQQVENSVAGNTMEK